MIAHLTLMILGKTAQLHCSAGATLTMTDVIHNATMQDVCMMALIVRTWRDNATPYMTNTAKTTMLMATVIKAAIMLSVVGMAWTVPICLRSLLWVSY